MKCSAISIHIYRRQSKLLFILLLGITLCSVPNLLAAQPVEICSGSPDNYLCPEEPVSPDPALLGLFSAQNAANPCFGLLAFDNFPGQTKCNGTDIPSNAYFIHQLTFPVSSGNVITATLQFRAKAAPDPNGQTHTDFIAFFEGATYITGANLSQLPGANGTWNPNQDAMFTLQLGNLPAAFSVNNILQHLNDGDLDIVIGNETGVDWMCISPTSTSPQVSTRYEIQRPRCKYTLIPPRARWLISMRSVDSGGRDSVSSSPYHLQTAVLKPTAFPAPNVLFTDSLGNPVFTSFGEGIMLFEDNAVAAKIQGISPAPPGYEWYGLQSNPITPSDSPNPDSAYFDIAFDWTDLPPGSEDSTGAFWMSDDKDDLYQELITDAFTTLDTSRLAAKTDYGIEVKNCVYQSDPFYVKWNIYWWCHDYGNRPSVVSMAYHLQTAVLKPVVFPAPIVTLTDFSGNPVQTAFGEQIILSESSSVAAKIQGFSPAPPGYEWYGLQSNSLTPSESPTQSSQDFKIDFLWSTLPMGSQDSTGAFWVSDNKDDLYDEFITDAFTLLDAAQLTAQKEIGKNNTLRLFPNPTSHTFTLELPEPATPGTSFRIAGITGQTLLQQRAEAGSRLQVFDLSALPAGMYFVQVWQEGSVVGVGRVVRQ